MLINAALGATFLSEFQRSGPLQEAVIPAKKAAWQQCLPVCASAVTAVVPLCIPRRALDSWRRTSSESVARTNTYTAEDWNRPSAAQRSPLAAEVEEFAGAVEHWPQKCAHRAVADRAGCALVATWLVFAIYDARLEPPPTSEAKRGRRTQTSRELEPYKTNTFAANSLGAEIKEASSLAHVFAPNMLPKVMASIAQVPSGQLSEEINRITPI